MRDLKQFIIDVFRKNVGLIDAIVRGALSSLMIYYGFFNRSLITDEVGGVILGCFGIIILATGIFNRCPLYSFIGVDTYNKKSE